MENINSNPPFEKIIISEEQLAKSINKNKTGKYVDFRSDWGFKKYFKRKEILIAFLNDFFDGEKVIVDLEYVENECDGDTEETRRVIFDLQCKGADGEILIIEMQQLRQDYYLDRAVYYTSRKISEHVKKGPEGNDYQLPEVYFIAVLDFRVNPLQLEQYMYDIAMMDKYSNEIIYKKLGYKLIVLPNFVKQGSDIVSDMDQWIWILKNISDAKQMPDFLDKRKFGILFEIGEVAKLKKEELMEYEASLKQWRDAESTFATARRDGIREGEEIGEERKNHEVVTNLLSANKFSDEEIASFAGVYLSYVQKVREELKNKKN